VDGRVIADAADRPVMLRLRSLYQAAIEDDVAQATRR
jgi:hypothetical protein